MATYKVQFVSPCEKNKWQAVTTERNVEASSVNDLLHNALDSFDIENGTRILKISVYIDGNWAEVV